MAEGPSQTVNFRASSAPWETSCACAPVNSTIDLGQVAAGRSHLYCLLRDAFNALPSAAVLAAMMRSPVLDAAVADDIAGRKALSTLRQVATGLCDDAPEMAEIAVERTRLLRGLRPGQGLPPACESAYRRDGNTGDAEDRIGRAWTALLERYRRDAFLPDRTVPPDFLGNELAYLAHLSGLEAEAWRRGDSVSALAAAAGQQAFLRAHLGVWIGALAGRVATAAVGAFWPGLLAFVEAYLRLDDDYLSGLLDGAGGTSARSTLT